MSKKVWGKVIFAVLFVAIACTGTAFVVRGINGIMAEKTMNNNDPVSSDRPLVPSTPNNHQTTKPNHTKPPFSTTTPENYPIDAKGNIGINRDTQPIEWGPVRSSFNRPDEFPCELQYRHLVKVKYLTNKFEQGLLLDFYDVSNEANLLDRGLILQILNNIYIDGYVYFNGASSSIGGVNSGQAIPFNLKPNTTLYSLINSREYIDMKAADSQGNPVPPSYIMVQLTYNPNTWYYNNNSYKLNLPKDSYGNPVTQENLFFDVNIRGYTGNNN